MQYHFEPSGASRIFMSGTFHGFGLVFSEEGSGCSSGILGYPYKKLPGEMAGIEDAVGYHPGVDLSGQWLTGVGSHFTTVLHSVSSPTSLRESQVLVEPHDTLGRRTR